VNIGIAEVVVAGEWNRPTTDPVDAVLEVISQIFSRGGTGQTEPFCVVNQ